MVDITICEVCTIKYDIRTYNIRFYLLEVPYPHKYCKITHKRKDTVNTSTKENQIKLQESTVREIIVDFSLREI